MTNIVTGYTDIIAPPNLATNGSFAIDQRMNFDNDIHNKVSKIGDYVFDMWFISNSTNVDYMTVVSRREYNYLQLKGYGKKGQIIRINNREDTDMGPNPVDGLTPLTSVLTCGIFDSVKVSASVRPFTSSRVPHSIIYDSPTLLENGKNHTVFSITETRLNDIYSNNGYINFVLEDDGEFGINVFGYGIYEGAYKTPPIPTVVPYADDLARCQRYYQTGDTAFTSSPTGDFSTLWFCWDNFLLPNTMSTTPTFSTILNLMQTRDPTIRDRTSLCTSSTPVFDNKHFTIDVQTGDATVGAEWQNRDALINVSWVAEVV